IEQSSKQGNELKRTRKKAIAETVDQIDFPLEWKMDSSHFTTIPFKGYTAGTRKSAISDLFVLFYDHNKPFTKDIPFYDNYLPGKIINKPKAYLIPRGWWQVLDLLKINRVEMHPISNDTVIE